MEKEIFMKYNPYKLETEILIDGKAVQKNSALNVGEKRLQEWIEELPDILVEECNVRNFRLKFHGTYLDYEDVAAVASAAGKRGITIEVTRIPAKEIADKEKAIQKVFRDIQNGPFEELKQNDVVMAFEDAKSRRFPVNVVATMSAGKSTLINALLNRSLMPTRNEACTAKITEIVDNDQPDFRAETYDKNGNLIENRQEVTGKIMKEFNEDPAVAKIVAEGNIPFVKSDDISLVLVDTPGTTYSRDPDHQAITYRLLNETSRPLILYIMNATQLAVTDDARLLTYVADKMKVGGKQSKDRFIFVLNKMDAFMGEEDDVESAIKKVREYLADKGIEEPNIFPASALTALDIRTICGDIDFSKEETMKRMQNDPGLLSAYSRILGINQNEKLHFETYAPLTPSMKGEINEILRKAEETGDIKQTALVHTGIIPIEAAIRQYVDKYAKTAKIKNIVDTFARKLESAGSFEKLKEEILSNEQKRSEIAAQIEELQEKVQNGKNAQEFKKTINKLNYDKEIKETAGKVIAEAQKAITKQLENCRGKKFEKAQAEAMCNTFSLFANELQAQAQVELEESITEQLNENAAFLLQQYKERLADLTAEIQTGSVSISPFALLQGDKVFTGNVADMVNNLLKEEPVKTGEKKWVKNPEKKWYKPWSWFQEKGHWEDIFEIKEYIAGETLWKQFFAPIQKQLLLNKESAIAYTQEQVETIKRIFGEKFDELDDILGRKLAELKKCTTDINNTDEMIKQMRQRQQWLEKIQKQMDEILAI